MRSVIRLIADTVDEGRFICVLYLRGQCRLQEISLTKVVVTSTGQVERISAQPGEHVTGDNTLSSEVSTPMSSTGDLVNSPC